MQHHHRATVDAPTDPLVIAAASPPDRHGYFSLGVSADYTASFIGRARFFLEVTDDMPRTFGRNQIHSSQVVGWCRSDRPLIEVPPVAPDETDTATAQLIADRISHRVRSRRTPGPIDPRTNPGADRGRPLRPSRRADL